MPELPEVEIIVRDLKKTILGRKFGNVWSDFKKIVKRPKNFNQFQKEIKNKKILNIWRRGKNILFNLSENKILLIHQKLTGHFLVGNWQLITNNWQPVKEGPLEEPINRFIHLMFWLDDGRMLALSDLRKFAKVELWNKEELTESKEFKGLGPEPLAKNFTFEKFKKALRLGSGQALQQARGKPFGLAQAKIKQVLMDQKIIAGIGNIYSDEILWQAKIHPFRRISTLKEEELKSIYLAIKKILPIAIKLGGESISDFRRITGEPGYFDKERKIYRREGESCFRCGRKIKRTKIGTRSVHYCPHCQIIDKKD